MKSSWRFETHLGSNPGWDSLALGSLWHSSEGAIQRRPAHSEISGDRRWPVSRLDACAGLIDLLIGKDTFAPLVLALRLGDGDPLGLAFTDDGPLELGERPEQREHEVSSRILGAGGVGGPLVDELHARALRGDLANDLLEIDQGSSESVHRGNDELVTVSQVPDALGELHAVRARTCGLLLDVDLVALPHRLELTCLVLISG